MIGEIISDKYKIVAPISDSHMYEVFKALEIATGATVVIKFLKEEMAVNTERVKSFSEEVRSFASLSHPMIAEVLDIDMLDDRPYVVTQLVDGKDLHTWIKGDIISFADALNITRDLATVLQYAADQGNQHRNIKLSNVLRNKDGKVKILSFTHPRLKLAGRSKKSENSGVHSDLFFLGTTFFELLAGESPIRKRGGINELWDMKLEKQLRIRHSDLTPDQISKVVEFVRKTLTRDLKNRFESHEEFLKSLADLHTIARGNTIRKNSKQLSMASQVVDALNGRMSNVNMSLPGMPVAQGKAMEAGSQTINRLGKGADTAIDKTGIAAVVDGNLALAAEEDGAAAEGAEFELSAKASKTPNKPKLKVLKFSASEQNKELWNESEEVHWLRNPVLIMGTCLLVMILVILFW
ncbi:MAG: hypothetical protein Kow0029_04860 [Candidatus Rifleibacteriota bacterium]